MRTPYRGFIPVQLRARLLAKVLFETIICKTGESYETQITQTHRHRRVCGAIGSARGFYPLGSEFESLQTHEGDVRVRELVTLSLSHTLTSTYLHFPHPPS